MSHIDMAHPPAAAAAAVQDGTTRCHTDPCVQTLEQDAVAAAAEVERDTVTLLLNGARVQVTDPEQAASWSLLRYLRDARRLTGAKLGCGEGGCGACTVLVSRVEESWSGERSVRHRSVNACLTPLAAVDGCAVTTVEGIGTTAEPHAVQSRLAQLHGSQCGFCTPGIVMAVYGQLQETPRPTTRDIEECLSGNLCRCTGYRPILDAAKTFARDVEAAYGEDVNQKCYGCPNASACGVTAAHVSETGKELVHTTTVSKVVAPRPEEAPLPPMSSGAAKAEGPAALPEDVAALTSTALHIHHRDATGGAVSWYRPNRLEALLRYTASTGSNGLRFIVGNSEIGVLPAAHPGQRLVSLSAVPELLKCGVEADGAIRIGASTPLQAVMEFLKECPGAAASPTAQAMVSMLHWFASKHVRNTASLGGNLCTASPIGDMAPTLLAVGATLTAARWENGAVAYRSIAMSAWITGYRRVSLAPGEVLVAVTVPAACGATCAVRAFKQSRRRDDDISIVTSSFVATRAAAGDGRITVKSAHGGVAPTAVTLADLDTVLEELLNDAAAAATPGFASKLVAQTVASALPMGPKTPGGMPAYRRTLVTGFALRFVRYAQRHFFGGTPASDDEDHLTAPGAGSLTRGSQTYVKLHGPRSLTSARPFPFSPAQQADGTSVLKRGPVGEVVVHTSGLAQCTGEAKYAGDVAMPSGSLVAALLFSTRATGAFRLEGHEAAQRVAKVRGVVSAADLTVEANAIGIDAPDEELFRRSTVTSVGQLIAMVVAETDAAAKAGLQALTVVWLDTDGEPMPESSTSGAPRAVVTIEEAIAAGSYLLGSDATHPSIREGDPEGAFARADIVTVTGELRIGGQEHFYLEPMVALAVPGECGEMELLSSTQWNTIVQSSVSHVLGVAQHKIVVKTRRLGGGFGGKETRAAWVSCAAAVAARKVGLPVRVTLERSQDMASMGARHPFLVRYKIAATPSDGRIIAFDSDMYSNTGFSSDLGYWVMSQAVIHAAGPFDIPNMHVRGHVCVTNTVTNTAFRGFGGPQAAIAIETAVEQLASALHRDPTEVRQINLIQEGNVTHFGRVVSGQTLNRMWATTMSSDGADFERRRAEVVAYNAAHTHKKRGIAMTAVLFGVGWPGPMHQGGALVSIYLDGSVYVSTGAIEMGQGVNTKIQQVVAGALDIPMNLVFIRDTDTSVIPNATASAASSTFDLFGMAALDASQKLMARLAPYLEDSTEPRTPEERHAAFTKAVNAAYAAKVSLSATGFTNGRVPPPGQATGGFDLNFDFSKSVPRGMSNAIRGSPMQYWTQGVCCCEVELDGVTGDTRVLRADLLMDVGESPNPGIDIGQIEGAFMQGLGLYLMEEPVWGSESEHAWLRPGACFTRGPGSYKIPTANDVPLDMRVTLLADAPNPRAIHSSKAVGEPPLLLGVAGFMAVKDAIAAFRGVQRDWGKRFTAVQSPLNVERARMSIGDEIAEMFAADNKRQGGLDRPALFC